MKKVFFGIILLLAYYPSISQSKKTFVGFTPLVNKTIKGIGIGLSLNGTSKTIDYSVIKGLNIEIIGLGIILPIVPSSPIHTKSEEFYADKQSLDSVIRTYDSSTYKIKGISISPGGVAGSNINIDGLNLSGLNTLVGKMNGVSTALMINYSGVVNGISIGFINETLKTHGLQLGFFNTTTQLKGLQIGFFNYAQHLKGFQIGLWNKNPKRKLPFVNWNFE